MGRSPSIEFGQKRVRLISAEGARCREFALKTPGCQRLRRATGRDSQASAGSGTAAEIQVCRHLPGAIMSSKVEWCFMQRNVPAVFLALTLFVVVPMYVSAQNS